MSQSQQTFIIVENIIELEQLCAGLQTSSNSQKQTSTIPGCWQQLTQMFPISASQPPLSSEHRNTILYFAGKCNAKQCYTIQRSIIQLTVNIENKLNTARLDLICLPITLHYITLEFQNCFIYIHM